MNRRQVMFLPGLALAQTVGSAQTEFPAPGQNTDGAARNTPDKILLKDYRPRSIYKIPRTEVKKARYPVFDAHCHGARRPEQLDDMVKTMDAAGIEKTVIFTGAETPERFAQARDLYGKYPGRFDLWCSFDLTGVDEPGFGPNAIKMLDECHRLGALGIGEISDKGRGFGGRGGGRGFRGGVPDTRTEAPGRVGPHADDPRMDALWNRCAQLGMPINIHISDPIWAYEPMDNTNDGLMNGYTWRITPAPGTYSHNELIESLERAVQKHPRTVFIACHLINLDYDLTRLGQIFDRHPNLYVDISARFAETAPIPRFASQFFHKYPDRVLYGTDMAYTQRMFSTTFRILETNDEHFYERDLNFNFDYHWPLNGFGLPDAILKKVYGDNARRAFAQARGNAG
jgi:hypothetical protein